MSNMTGLENIKKQLFSFDGNISRMRFFVCSIVTLPIIIFCFLGFLSSAVRLEEIYPWREYWDFTEVVVSIVFGVISLCILIISLMVFSSFVIRRLNDLSLSWKFYFISFIPVFNIVFILMLFLVKGVNDDEEKSY